MRRKKQKRSGTSATHLQLRPVEMGHFLRTIALFSETPRGVNIARQAAAAAPILMRTPGTIFTSSLKSNQAERERAGDEVYFFSRFAVWIRPAESTKATPASNMLRLFVWREVSDERGDGRPRRSRSEGQPKDFLILLPQPG